MESEKIKEDINDIKLELAYMRGMLENVSHQMQKLREEIGESSNKDTGLPVREFYVHPWHQYQREQFVTGGNCQQSEGDNLSDI
jgi:hypothetical protein